MIVSANYIYRFIFTVLAERQTRIVTKSFKVFEEQSSHSDLVLRYYVLLYFYFSVLTFPTNWVNINVIKNKSLVVICLNLFTLKKIMFFRYTKEVFIACSCFTRVQ